MYSIIECRCWTEEFAGACERKRVKIKKEVNHGTHRSLEYYILAELCFRAARIG